MKYEKQFLNDIVGNTKTETTCSVTGDGGEGEGVWMSDDGVNHYYTAPEAVDITDGDWRNQTAVLEAKFFAQVDHISELRDALQSWKRVAQKLAASSNAYQEEAQYLSGDDYETLNRLHGEVMEALEGYILLAFPILGETK